MQRFRQDKLLKQLLSHFPKPKQSTTNPPLPKFPITTTAGLPPNPQHSRFFTSSCFHHKRVSEEIAKILGTRGSVLLLRSGFRKHRVDQIADTWQRQWRRGRWNSWSPTAESVLWGLISANAFVFVLWRYADPSFMRRNFMISLDNIKSGRLHTLITCAFSHIDGGHLFSNMIGLYFFGNTIGQSFGPVYLLKLYLAGAVAGSVFYLVHKASISSSGKGSRTFYGDPSRTPGLGASGAVNAIMLLDIFLHPKAIMYLNFFIPVPAMLAGAFLIGKDVLLVKEGESRTSGSAHLGGAVVAALAWARIKRGWI